LFQHQGTEPIPNETSMTAQGRCIKQRTTAVEGGFSNSDPSVVMGDFPWYGTVWRNLRGDFKPLAAPAGGYATFATGLERPGGPRAAGPTSAGALCHLAGPRVGLCCKWVGSTS